MLIKINITVFFSLNFNKESFVIFRYHYIAIKVVHIWSYGISYRTNVECAAVKPKCGFIGLISEMTSDKIIFLVLEYFHNLRSYVSIACVCVIRIKKKINILIINKHNNFLSKTKHLSIQNYSERWKYVTVNSIMK